MAEDQVLVDLIMETDLAQADLATVIDQTMATDLAQADLVTAIDPVMVTGRAMAIDQLADGEMLLTADPDTAQDH